MRGAGRPRGGCGGVGGCSDPYGAAAGSAAAGQHTSPQPPRSAGTGASLRGEGGRPGRVAGLASKRQGGLV